MRRYIAYTTLLLALVCGLAYAGRPIGKISPRDTKVRKVDNELVVKSTLSLDSLHLGANNQIYVTPIIESPSGQSEVLPLGARQRPQHALRLRAGLDAP